jgi:GMP synthase (glutamine-hydrolysing)
MMTGSILVVNCARNEDLLTKREFVWPIQRALHEPSRVVHLSKLKKEDVLAASAVIFSGCPLADNAFLQFVPKLSWLKRMDVPMLGICAGHQLLGRIFGGKISHAEKAVIGWTKLQKKKSHTLLKEFPARFSAFELHGNRIACPKDFSIYVSSAHNPNEVMIHQKKKIVGVEFHPEVRNEKLLQAFVKWAQK